MDRSQEDPIASVIRELADNAYLLDVPEFGLFHPSVAEAAELVVVDMWFSCEISNVIEPDDFGGSASEPWLKEALAERITAFEARLIAAIDAGKLNASPIRRDIDERLIPQKTHIGFDHLLHWMRERGIEEGDHIAEWAYSEATICEMICDEVVFLRNTSLTGELKGIYSKQQSKRIDAAIGNLDESSELADVQAALRAKINEIFQLRKLMEQSGSGQPAGVDRPLHTRQRRTLLTIIAALCDHANIDYTARGAAQRIRSIAELLGAPIDDGTIDKVLKEIPDALETRLK
jgi:hypothetical protein